MRSEPAHHPAGRDIAFKEWSGICQAIAQGRQSILLRKGGIAESNGAFTPDHPEFWLYPTHVHEHQQGLREFHPSKPAAETIPIDTFVRVQGAVWLGALERALVLAPYHIWTEETIRSRFHYRKPGLWLLLIRAYRRAEPAHQAVLPEYAGCHTWLTFPDPIPGPLTPALPEAEHEQAMRAVRAALDSPWPREAP